MISKVWLNCIWNLRTDNDIRCGESTGSESLSFGISFNFDSLSSVSAVKGPEDVGGTFGRRACHTLITLAFLGCHCCSGHSTVKQ